MSNEPIFSRAELCAISGAPHDAVVFWDRQGLILGQQSGARAHKRYSKREVKFAALLFHMRSMGMNVGFMREVVETLRTCLEFHDSLPVGHSIVQYFADLSSFAFADTASEAELSELGSKDRATYRDSHDHILEDLKAGRISETDATAMRKVRDNLPLERSHDWWLAEQFEAVEGYLVIYRDEHGSLKLDDLIGERTPPFAVAQVLNYERILDLSWPDQGEVHP